jgi:hypothetical protein
VAATVQSTPVVRGNNQTWTFTLSGAGSIAGATLTANVRKRGSPQVLVSAVSLTIADATLRTVTLTLSSTQTNALIGDALDPSKLVMHALDVVMVLSAVTTTFGPLLFPVRTGA